MVKTKTNKDEVIKIIKEVACVKEVGLNTKLREDLYLDSLDLVELQIFLESEFSIDVDDDKAEEFLTVQDVINFVDKNSK